MVTTDSQPIIGDQLSGTREGHATGPQDGIDVARTHAGPDRAMEDDIGQNRMVASSDDLPHTADEAGGQSEELPDEDHRGDCPEPKRSDVESKEEEDGNNQGHSLGENDCTLKMLKDLGVTVDKLSWSLSKILGVDQDHPIIKKLTGNEKTKPTGRWVGNAWINCMEVLDDDYQTLAATEEYPEVEFEVALDSGAVVHVCANADTLGYVLEESPGSRRGQQFLMGDGGKLGNIVRRN